MYRATLGALKALDEREARPAGPSPRRFFQPSLFCQGLALACTMLSSNFSLHSPLAVIGRRVGAAFVCALVWSCLPAIAGTGPSVREIIEFTRIIQPVLLDDLTLRAQRSPDGRHAFIVTRRGDVATDTNRFEILLLDVSAQRLERAGPPAPLRLLSVEARRDESDATPAVMDVRWSGNGTLLLRARIKDEAYQAYRLDVASGRLVQLTFAPHGVLAFDASADLGRVVYTSPVPNPPMPPGSPAIVVGTQSFWTVHFGQHKFGNQQRRYQFFVANPNPNPNQKPNMNTNAASREPVRSRDTAQPLGDSFAEANLGVPAASISPDGRWALVPRYEAHRQLLWSRHYPYVAEVMATFGASLTMDPLSYFSRPSSYVARRIVAYRLSDRQEHLVLDAPDDARQDTQGRAPGLWQDGGKSVVIAGTFLPQRPVVMTQDSASHVVEFWPDTGLWRDVAVLGTRAKAAYAMPPQAGGSGGFVVMDGDRPRRFVRRSIDASDRSDATGRWREVGGDRGPDGVSAPNSALSSVAGAASVVGVAGASVLASAAPAWELRVRQSLNEPPDIVASVVQGGQSSDGTNQQSVRLTALNPQFSTSRWGTMREYGWTDELGRPWKGGLMVPAGFDRKARHALVIQAYGFSPTRFYRDGSNLYDGFTSGFPGRAFLAENMLVLALPLGPADGARRDEREQRIAFAQGVRAAVDALAAEGIVDRDKVGIMGWSATGESVLNLVTFTDAPIRAASLLDGDANTLFSLTVTYAATDVIQMKKEQANQGGPFGASRQRWLANDPSLHTECVRAALRIETYGQEVHNNWDIYALLRRQYKPAEMLLFPEGAHALARPSQRMVSLQGNLDWMRYWLKGEKRSEVLVPYETAASLRQQYVRWDQMLELKRAEDAKPVCDRSSASS